MRLRHADGPYAFMPSYPGYFAKTIRLSCLNAATWFPCGSCVFLFCLDIELITLEVTSPFVGAGLNRESLLTSYERMLTAHPNIRLVMLGELFVVLF